MKTYMFAAMAAMALVSAAVVPVSAAETKTSAQTETNVTAGDHSGDFDITKTVFSSDHWLEENR